MKRPPTLCGRRADPCLPVICFLCGHPVLGADLAHSFVRALEGTVPARFEHAHADCAAEAGLEEGPDPEEERPR